MEVDTAVILAGGEGERLRPLTRNRPKPLLPAGNRPIIEYVLDSVIEAGISDIHVVVGYKHNRVQSHLGDTYSDVDLTYHIQEKQLGSGHALLQARDAVTDPFLVVNGDQITEPSIITDVLSAHDAAMAASMGVIESDKAAEYGTVSLTDGNVTDLTEHPETDAGGLLNAGVYVFTPEIFSVLADLPRPGGVLTIPAGVSALVADPETAVLGVETDGFWTDATYPWDLLTVAEQVFSMDWIDLPSQETDVWVADSATIHPAAELVPPVVVGVDSEIAAGAVIGPHVALGRNTTVGSNSVLTRTVLDTDCRVGANTTLIDTVFGQNVTVGSSSVVTGGRNDIQLNDRVYPDRELGCVIADRTTVGGGVTIGGGLLLGSDATIDDGVSLSRNVADDAEVRE
jgi:glucose-1-phosphate thymidylyltransferase